MKLSNVLIAMLIFVSLSSCRQINDDDIEEFLYNVEWKQILIACSEEHNSVDEIIKTYLYPDSNGEEIYEEELMDNIYPVRIDEFVDPFVRIFFLRNNALETISLCFINLPPQINSYSIPNPNLYNLTIYRLGGTDSLLSVFFFKSPGSLRNDCIGTITSSNDAYYTDIFQRTCGNRNCDLDWLNQLSPPLYYHYFRNVRKYEDFIEELSKMESLSLD